MKPAAAPAPAISSQPSGQSSQIVDTNRALLAGESLPDSDAPDFFDEYSWLIRVMLMSAMFIVIGVFAPTEDEAGESVFLSAFLVFVLSICIGYMVIWNVTPALHTPLMSVTNAISGIIVIGGMLELLPVDPAVMFDSPSILGVLGVFFASINVIGGFVVTQRMLNMFRKD
jgi:NAD(P) transhydrogenase subunit alpha